jgi:plastocyanin
MSTRLPLTLVLVLSLAGCGSSKPAAKAPTAARTATVAIASFKYRAPTVHVRAGGRVTWVNHDSAGHTATFTAGPSKLDTDRLKRAIAPR